MCGLGPTRMRGGDILLNNFLLSFFFEVYIKKKRECTDGEGAEERERERESERKNPKQAPCCQHGA